MGNPSSPVCVCAAGPIIRAGQLSAFSVLSVEVEEMPLRANGLFINGKHPSPEMRAKISAGLRRHWLQRERSARIAAEEARAERNLEAVRKQLAVAKGFK